VLGNAERMEAEAIAVERVVQGRDVALSGVVRLTTVEVIANLVLPRAIAALHAQYPGISVDVLSESRSLSLSKREADLAIRMTRFEGNELVSRRMATSGTALYASSDYLARHGVPPEGTDHAIIAVLEDQAYMPEAVWLRDVMAGARVAVRTNSRDAQLAYAKAGLGVVCLPCFLADGVDGLERIEALGAGPQREIWLGVHADLRHMPRIRAVMDVIDREFSRLKGQFSG